MATTSTGKGRPSRAAHSRALVQQVKALAHRLPQAWESSRGHYPAAVADVADRVVREGLTFGDLAVLEYAEHQQMAALRALTLDPGLRRSYTRQMASSRRHMRLLIERQGGGQTNPGDQPVPISDELAEMIGVVDVEALEGEDIVD